MTAKLATKIRFEKYIISRISKKGSEARHVNKLSLNELYRTKLSSSELDLFIHKQNEKIHEEMHALDASRNRESAEI